MAPPSTLLAATTAPTPAPTSDYAPYVAEIQRLQAMLTAQAHSPYPDAQFGMPVPSHPATVFSASRPREFYCWLHPSNVRGAQPISGADWNRTTLQLERIPWTKDPQDARPLPIDTLNYSHEIRDFGELPCPELTFIRQTVLKECRLMISVKGDPGIYAGFNVVPKPLQRQNRCQRLPVEDRELHFMTIPALADPFDDQPYSVIIDSRSSLVPRFSYPYFNKLIGACSPTYITGVYLHEEPLILIFVVQI